MMKSINKLYFLSLGLLLLGLVSGMALAGSGDWTDDERLIHQCIELSKSSAEKGNHPFGALMVKDGKVIMTAENTVITDRNEVHHAETNLIAAVSRKYGSNALRGATLYSSCEPCPMCCGAIYMAGIDRVVYGLSAKRLSAMSGSVNTIDARRFFSLSERDVQITGPLLETEAAAIMTDFLKNWKPSEQEK